MSEGETAMARLLIFGLMLFSFSGCASLLNPQPTLAEIQSADYGTQPPDNYEKIIKECLDRSLYDPYSAHYRYGKPWKGWEKIIGEKAFYGYYVDIAVNAKNGFGAYTGDTFYRFNFFNGKIVKWEQIFPHQNPQVH